MPTAQPGVPVTVTNPSRQARALARATLGTSLTLGAAPAGKARSANASGHLVVDRWAAGRCNVDGEFTTHAAGRTVVRTVQSSAGATTVTSLT